MSAPASPRALRLALRRAWARIRQRWFDQQGKDTASGDDVREALREWLDRDPDPQPNLIRFWRPLDDGQKQAALLDALPDEEYASAEADAELDVIRLLREYDARFREILDLIGDKRSLGRDEKQRAQTLLKDLKADLEEDAREEGRRQDVTECERRYFYPAVRKAHANIRVRWNTDPIKSNWHSELYGARMDITHLLHQLEHPVGEDEG